MSVGIDVRRNAERTQQGDGMSTTTMNRRRVLEALAADRDSKSVGVATKVGIGSAALVVVTLVALWLAGFFSTPAEVLAIRSLVDAQIAELERVGRNEAPLSYDGAAFGETFDKLKKAPESIRRQVRGEMDRLFRARERAELQSYFGLPADKRRAELDRRIKAEEARRKAWQEQRAARGGSRGNAGGRGDATAGGSRGGGGQRGEAGGGTGGGGPQRGGGAPGGGRGTEDGRNARAKQRIDSSTGEQRAQSAEYRRVMDERRQQLGLPSGRGRGG